MKTKTRFLISLALCCLTTACAKPDATLPPAAIGITPTATTTSLPATARPTTTVFPAPSVTLTSTPSPESRWQCDPSGGLACFSHLYYVTMLNSEEGWAVGDAGMVLHYTILPCPVILVHLGSKRLQKLLKLPRDSPPHLGLWLALPRGG